MGNSPKRLVSYEVTPTRTSFVAGAGSILVGTLPIISSGPMTVWRVLTASTFYLLGALLMIGGAATKRPRTTVDLKARTLRGPGRSGSLDGATRIRLSSGIQIVKAAEQAAYRAELCFGDGAAILMAEDEDPGAVARAAHLLSAELELPIVSGWGLPADAAPWDPPERLLAGTPAPEAAGAGDSELIVRYGFDRTVSWIVSACAVLIGGTTLILVATGAAGAPAGPVLFSYGLVTGMILLVLLVASAAGTRHLRLTAGMPGGHGGGARLRVEWRTLGIPSGRHDFPREGLGPAFPVRPTKEVDPTHLLFRTEEGAFALPCPDQQQLASVQRWLSDASEV